LRFEALCYRTRAGNEAIGTTGASTWATGCQWLPSHDRERATILQRISAAKKRNVFSALFLLRFP
jgi:hypothetical protein